MPSAPGVAGVRVREVMSRGPGPQTGAPPPEDVDVGYPLFGARSPKLTTNDPFKFVIESSEVQIAFSPDNRTGPTSIDDLAYFSERRIHILGNICVANRLEELTNHHSVLKNDAVVEEELLKRDQAM